MQILIIFKIFHQPVWEESSRPRMQQGSRKSTSWQRRPRRRSPPPSRIPQGGRLALKKPTEAFDQKREFFVISTIWKIVKCVSKEPHEDPQTPPSLPQKTRMKVGMDIFANMATQGFDRDQTSRSSVVFQPYHLIQRKANYHQPLYQFYYHGGLHV